MPKNSSWNFAYFDALYMKLKMLLQRQFHEKNFGVKKLNCKALIILINCFIVHYAWWIVIFPLIQSIQNFRYVLTEEVTTKTEIVSISTVLNKEDKKIASILCQCKQELHNIVFLKFKFMNFHIATSDDFVVQARFIFPFPVKTSLKCSLIRVNEIV